MKLTPYLTFGGNCEEAINFYKEIFDGTITTLMRFNESPLTISDDPDHTQNILHAVLRFKGCEIMLSDNVFGKLKRGNTNYISIAVKEEDEAKDFFYKLADQGRVLMPFEVAFWGGKFGAVIDKFGIQWMISGGSQQITKD